MRVPILIVLCCITAGLYAQNRPSSDAVSSDLYIRLGRKSPLRDSVQALKYFQQALQLEEKNENKLGIARTYLAIGSWYNSINNYNEAEKHLLIARENMLKDTSREGRLLLASTKVNLAIVLGNKGQTQLQAEEYLQTIPILEKANAIPELNETYQSLGDIFSNKSQYKTAIAYYYKSLGAYSDPAPYCHLIASRHLRLANAMYHLDSLHNMETNLAAAKEKLDRTGVDSINIWADYYHLQGKLDVKRQMYNRAATTFYAGLSIARRTNYNSAICNNLYSLARLFEKQGMYDRAMVLMDEYGKLSYTLKDFPFRLRALDLMADLSFKQHFPDQAYNYLRQYIILADSLKELTVTEKIHELEAEYQSSEKENRIMQLQHENERQEFALQKNRLLISLMVVIMLSLFVVAALSYLFYRNGRKLLEQQRQLHQFEVERIRQEHKISLLSAMLEGQEKERTRLARDLHDGLGGLLSGIKLELSTVNPSQTDVHRQSLIQNTLQRLDGAMDELRRIARSMMPEILIKYGLGEATVEYCRGLKKTGTDNIVCQVFNFQVADMEHTRQVVLYRIMQELVNNAIKHAEASQILVLLQQTDKTLFLTVEDDGKGFDAAAGNKLKGAGLANIEARVEFLGGKIDIQSEPGTGTAITIECTTSLN
ncbi:tetratricopeptide repeat-containing sensor histidine kinase [Chitinophaga pinensis]|uniref:Histidine kinase n=1 Tax=Chitinophaga pinensis (strain ATCC 43595 / DSM 2588 / LMG 13176 / NBRC 15968 / NCIMB 11800 / UQM 2034) TaxID=485918 RepID=A0A979G2Z9_CHIPD|nr:sensor histidine kinase [Chitinophaga pinensis]ACU59879.1 histidine kinase [Chitinophaga pinensis DSM 2588]